MRSETSIKEQHGFVGLVQLQGLQSVRLNGSENWIAFIVGCLDLCLSNHCYSRLLTFILQTTKYSTFIKYERNVIC